MISSGKPWPIAALDEGALDELAAKRVVPYRDNSRNLPVLLQSPKSLTEILSTTARVLPPPQDRVCPPKLILPIEFKIAVIVCIFWAGLHCYFRWKASVVRRPGCRAYFWPAACLQHAVVLNLGWASIGAAATALLRFSFHWDLDAIDDPLYRPLLAFVILACVVVPYIDLRVHPGDYTSKWQDWCAASVSLVAIGLFAGALFFLPAFNGATTVPEEWRAINLLSGVSPATPFVVLAIGGYLWCFQSLHGLALFKKDQPQLPTKKELDFNLPAGEDSCPDQAGLSLEERRRVLAMFASEDYDKAAERSLPFNRFLTRWAAAIGLLLLVLCWALRMHLRNLGPSNYSNIYGFVVLLSIAICIAEVVQLWSVWHSLQALLNYLDRLPLRRTMRDLKDFSWGSVWEMGGAVLERRYLMVSRQIETLHHLRSTYGSHKAYTFRHGQPAPALLVRKTIHELNTQVRCNLGPWFGKNYKEKGPIDLEVIQKFQGQTAALSGVLLVQVLLPAWSQETNSLIASADMTAARNPKGREHRVSAFPKRKSRPRSCAQLRSSSASTTLPISRTSLGAFVPWSLGWLFFF